MHEKYGWSGDYAASTCISAYQQLSTTLGDNSICIKVIELNDKGKSFSEIANWLEKIYLAEWI
jgi:hypothetical protein